MTPPPPSAAPATDVGGPLRRERLVLRLTTWTCVLVAASWFALSSGRGPDVLRLAAGLCVLLGIPAALAALTWLGRGGVLRTRQRRWWVRIAKLALVFAWVPAGAFVAFMVAVAQPWPLSLRQGPDTQTAREIFERHVGFAPPPSVSELFAKHEWAGPGEHILCVSFRFSDDAVLVEIAARLQLERAGDAPDTPTLPGPAWWPDASVLGRLDEVYGMPHNAPQRFVLLWVDRATGIAYLQDVDIA